MSDVDPVDPGWRFVSIGFEGDAVDVGGVNPWQVEWVATGGCITVAHPSYPAQRHPVLFQDIGDGMSQDIGDVGALLFWDVACPAGDHRCCHPEATGRAGRSRLRRAPRLGLQAPGPLQGRGRGRVRAEVPTSQDLTHSDPAGRGRPGPATAQGTDAAGLGRRSTHHLLAPGTPPPDPPVTGHRPPDPGPARPGGP